MNKWWIVFVFLIDPTINGMYLTDAALPVPQKKYLLHEASSMGKVEVVESLLESKADPNELNAQGFTPLMVAHACAVQPLLKAKADPEIVDPQRWLTPLMIASYNGNVRKVDLLLKSEHAIPAAATNDRMTALHFVVLAAYENDKAYRTKRWVRGNVPKEVFVNSIKQKGGKLATIAQNLLDYGANKNATDGVGKKPHHYLKQERFRRVWNTELIQVLKHSK